MPDDIASAASRVIEAFGQMYLFFYRRRDPRAQHFRGEALAVLEHLMATGPLTVTEAARHFDRSQAAMSEIVRRLVDRGVLASMADERDRRRHLIWLTPKGRAVHAEERQVLDEHLVQRAIAEMNEEDRTRLLSGLHALLEAAKRARHTTTKETTR